MAEEEESEIELIECAQVGKKSFTTILDQEEMESHNSTVFENECAMRSVDSNQEHSDLSSEALNPLFYFPLKKTASECFDDYLQSEGKIKLTADLTEPVSCRQSTGLSPCPTVTPKLEQPQLDSTNPSENMWILSNEVDKLLDTLQEKISQIYNGRAKPEEEKCHKSRREFQMVHRMRTQMKNFKVVNIEKIISIMSSRIEMVLNKIDEIDSTLVNVKDMMDKTNRTTNAEVESLRDEVINHLSSASVNANSAQDEFMALSTFCDDYQEKITRKEKKIEREPSFKNQSRINVRQHLENIIEMRENMRDISDIIKVDCNNPDLALFQNWAQMRRADMALYMEERTIRRLLSQPKQATFGPEELKMIDEESTFQKRQMNLLKQYTM